MATPTDDPRRQEEAEEAEIRERISRKLGKTWWAFAMRGVLAAAVGLGLLIWPSTSLAILVSLVGLYCVVDGAASLVALLRGGERDIYMTQALLGLLTGAVLLIWPGISIRALLILFGIWVLLTGGSQIVAARRLDLEGDERGMMTTVGALAALVGLVLIIWPGSGAVLVGWLVAVATLAIAGLLIFVALRLKRLRDRLDARAAFETGG